MKRILCSLIAITSITAYGQTLPRADVSKDSLKKHIVFLASDSLKGRAVGTPEQAVAANYIISKFKNYGLAPFANCSDYRQTFSLFQMDANIGGRITIEGNVHVFRSLNDFILASKEKTLPSEFVPYDDPSSAVAGNGIMLIRAKTLDEALENASHYMDKESDFIIDIPTREFIKILKDRMLLSSMLNVAADNNGDTIFSSSMLSPFPAKGNVYYTRMLPYLSKYPKARIILTDDFFVKKMIKQDEHVGKKISVEGSFSPELGSSISMSNVLGYIEGSELKDEVVIVGAHYDHLTMLDKGALSESDPKGDRIFNGADDNASGTVTVIEASRQFARYLAQGHKPKRSVLFVAFTGEELGLIGSDYLAKSPLLAGKKIHAVINADMVGRNANGMNDKDMYIYSLPMSDNGLFDQILPKAAKKAKLQLPPIPENERSKWSYGSDHYSFAQLGIAAVALTTGEHPDYHTVRDEWDKINYARLTRIAEFVFYSAWEAAEM